MFAVWPEAVFLTGLMALWLDRLVGYPARLRHPVELFGAAISWGDKTLNRAPESVGYSRIAGVAVIVLLCGAAGAAATGLTLLLRQWAWGFVLEALLAVPFLASKSLIDHVRAVENALGESIAMARKSVGRIVGRETGKMNESDVARAAIESLAENASDGVFAPLFWFLVAGLPGIVVYKVINTADSMIGYKSDHHRHFGWFAARLDDLVNLVPARLTGVLFVAAAAFSKTASAGKAFAAMWRDAKRHKSPNAGWPEAAVAGGLGLRLGGARSYGGVKVELPNMGDGHTVLSRSDIGAALDLLERTLWVTTLVFVALAATFWV